jgi:hypothetical protein
MWRFGLDPCPVMGHRSRIALFRYVDGSGRIGHYILEPRDGPVEAAVEDLFRCWSGDAT